MFRLMMAVVLVGACGGALAEGRVVEIARGQSWVSPYWGYSTPKIVSDGKAFYTAGLWDGIAASAEGVLYKYDGTWQEGAHLPSIYQPATLAIDKEGRVIAVYTVQMRPVQVWRSTSPGRIKEIMQLPSPPDMKNAYYIGIALREDFLYLAYLVAPDCSMFLTTLNLVSLEWRPSRLICAGQVEQKPKTAWTYPILYPTKDGLHLVASNAPDGGEGNTYNEVWYLFFPNGAEEPSLREKVADTPMGTLSYAMDLAVDGGGAPHILFLWNQHVYGDPLPADSPQQGLYHAWRDAASGKWQRAFLQPPVYAGFYESKDGLMAVTASNKLLLLQGAEWTDAGTLYDASRAPGPPGFFDVISRASGSDTSKGVAVVTDSLLPGESGQPQQRALWAILPK